MNGSHMEVCLTHAKQLAESTWEYERMMALLVFVHNDLSARFKLQSESYAASIRQSYDDRMEKRKANKGCA